MTAHDHSDPYVAQVAAALARYPDLPGHDRAEALADLAEVVAEMRGELGSGGTVTPAATGAAETAGEDPVVTVLGTPTAYAEQLHDALSDLLRDGAGGTGGDEDRPAPAQAHVLGVPVEWRGAVDARVRARIWDPANPALLVPRLTGAGWAVNLGAVAVRLGLIRPDDVDEDVLAHIPAGALRTARTIPVLVAGATALAVLSRRDDLPTRVPTSWSVTGRPQQWSGRWALYAQVIGGTAVAAWAQRGTDPEDALVRAALATWITTLAAGTTTAGLLDAEPGEHGHGLLVPAAVLAGATGSVATIVIPIRAGLRRLWHDQGLSQAGDRR